MERPSRTFDIKAHEERLDAAIRSAYSASFMSSAKWRKLFELLDRPELEIDQLVWKFVGRESAVRGAVPSVAGLEQSYVSSSSFAPFLYKEIEWIEIPPKSIPAGWESVPHKHRPQDIERVLSALAEIGQFEIARSESGARIHGFR